MTSSQTFDLSGRLVLVTGATRGIGRAVAIGAAAAGAELIITGRTTGALEEVDDAIRQTGGTATIVEMDMKDYPAMPRLAAVIHERWGRLDGFVANAAILAPLTPITHLTPENWDESVAVNLTGQWHMIRALTRCCVRPHPGAPFLSARALRLAAGHSGGPMRPPRLRWRRLAGPGPAKVNKPICGST